MQELKKKNKLDIVLPIILLSYFIILLDNSIVFTGTVKIQQELNLNTTELSWVTNAYSLTFGGLLLLGGRSGDIFGRKRMYNIGLIIFGLGSLFVGLATDAFTIIISRAFQGIGSAILAPTTLALLMDAYQGDARTKAVAAYGATAGIGSAIGLIIGGVLASLFSWRDGFFINVPVCMLMLFLSIKFIDEKNSSFGKIDVIGSVVSVIGMVSLVYSISGDSQQLVALIIAIIFMGFFVWFESRTLNPILPLSLFHNKERVGAYIARFTFMGSMLSLWFLTPQFLQNYFGYSPLIAGLAFFPLSFSIFVFSMAVSKLTKKWGNSKLMIVGLFITIIGMFNLMLFNNQSNYWMGIAVPMVIIGMGQGFSLSPLTSSGITQTSGEEAGAASGVVNMVHQIGGSIGLSIIISLTSNIKNIVTQFHYQMMIAAIYIVISFIVAIILIYKKTN